MGRGGAYKRERSSCNAARTFFHKEKSPYRQINSNIHAFWSILLKLKMCNKIPTFGSKHRKPTDGYIRQQWIRLKEIIVFSGPNEGLDVLLGLYTVNLIFCIDKSNFDNNFTHIYVRVFHMWKTLT